MKIGDRIMKIIIGLFAIVLTISLTACDNIPVFHQANHETETVTNLSVQEHTDSILRNIFKKTDFSIPDPYEIVTEARPLYDEEKEEFTFICHQEYPYTDAVGNEYYGSRYIRITTDLTGTVLSESDVCTFEDMRNIECVAITETAVFFCFYQFDTSYRQVYSLALVKNGEITEFTDLSGITGESRVDDVVLTPDDMPLLLVENTVFCFDASLQIQYSIPAYARSLSVYHDAVYCGGSRIQLENQRIEESLWDIEETSGGLWYYGSGYVAYVRLIGGLYGCLEDGGIEPVLDFENSDLMDSNVEILQILNPETILLSDSDKVGLYRKADDVDLSDVTTLDLAYTNVSGTLEQRIVEFNKSYPEIRVVVRQYDTDEDLLTDMITGIYQPDIVAAVSGESIMIREIIKQGMFTDLYPLIEVSSTIKSEDILGCVKRTYGTNDGKLAAITDKVQVNTVIGLKEIVGERTEWSVKEMLDTAATLPEGMALTHGLSQRGAVNRLFGDFRFAAFVDMGNLKSYFGTEDFLSYLEFIKTLPTKVDQNSFLRSERLEQYATGKLALAPLMYQSMADFLQENFIFPDKEYVRIGYPSSDCFPGGSYINAAPYIITSFCDAPEAAWRFLETVLFEQMVVGQSGGPMENGFPALQSRLQELCEQSKGYVYKYYLDGTSMLAPSTPEEPYDLSADTKEGTIRYYTEEDGAELMRWLDQDVGIPLSITIPQEVTDIVHEEISSYLAGVNTAADCAKVIHSRVGIWLSEHE